MAITIREAHAAELEALFPLLLQAEPSERALRWGLNNLIDAVYRMDDADILVGAATMRWRTEVPEIMELGIDPSRHRQGLGRRLVLWLADEARRRGHRALLVGTSNASVQNFIFYQKLGFRMDHIRRDYFRYYREPIYENGLRVRDLVMLRLDLEPVATDTIQG